MTNDPHLITAITEYLVHHKVDHETILAAAPNCPRAALELRDAWTKEAGFWTDEIWLFFEQMPGNLDPDGLLFGLWLRRQEKDQVRRAVEEFVLQNSTAGLEELSQAFTKIFERPHRPSAEPDFVL